MLDTKQTAINFNQKDTQIWEFPYYKVNDEEDSEISSGDSSDEYSYTYEEISEEEVKEENKK